MEMPEFVNELFIVGGHLMPESVWARARCGPNRIVLYAL